MLRTTLGLILIWIAGACAPALIAEKVQSPEAPIHQTPPWVPNSTPTPSVSVPLTQVQADPPTKQEAPPPEPAASPSPESFTFASVELPDPLLTAMSLGENHRCYMLNDGNNQKELYCQGANDKGQLGIGSRDAVNSRSTRQKVLLPYKVQTLVSGRNHNCILTQDGKVFCWGSNEGGQIGINTELGSSSLPREVALPLPALLLASGDDHVCAALSNHDVYCWGRNRFGQVGVPGPTYKIALPEKVDLGFPTRAVTDLTAGKRHTCALLESSVICWGMNYHGQTGNPVRRPIHHSAVYSQDIDGAGKVFGGPHHSCAVLIDGSARCWGADAYGESSGAKAMTRVDQLALGDGFTCALQENGSVECWGKISTRITFGVTGITARDHRVCAIVSGVLHCWSGAHPVPVPDTDY